MQILYWILAGLCAGVFGGMGMGGGTLLIPILVLLLGVDQKLSQSVNLISFLPMAAVSLIFHIRNKLVDFKAVLYFAVTGVAAAVFGAWLAGRVNVLFLKKLFGGFLAALGAFQLVSAAVKQVKERRQKKENAELVRRM